MTSESMKLYKLIILYFLSKTRHEITNAILSDFILEYGYTDYFSIQETLTSLTEDEMIVAKQTHTASYYSITEKGTETLNYFITQLPKDTMQQIQDYLTEHKMQIVDTASIRSDYTQTSPDEYLVRGIITECGSIMAEISITMPSEEAAIAACTRFKKKSDILYGFLLKELTTD